MVPIVRTRTSLVQLWEVEPYLGRPLGRAFRAIRLLDTGFATSRENIAGSQGHAGTPVARNNCCSCPDESH